MDSGKCDIQSVFPSFLVANQTLRYGIWYQMTQTAIELISSPNTTYKLYLDPIMSMLSRSSVAARLRGREHCPGLEDRHESVYRMLYGVQWSERSRASHNWLTDFL